LEPPLRRQLSLVYPQEKFRSKLLQCFLDFLEQSPMIKDFALPKVK
jgi:DNA-binding transcriptional LysR family regulator